MKPGHQRLFVAIPLPAALRNRLAALSTELEASTWDLSFPQPDDQHLTLHFLGETPERVIEDLKRELSAVAHARRPFDLHCGGLGAFPNFEEPRVLWAGLQDPAGNLKELHSDTLQIFNAYRLFKLSAEYVPHITVARVRTLSKAWDPRLLEGILGQWDVLGRFPVETIQLMRSQMNSDGLRYETVGEFKLGS